MDTQQVGAGCPCLIGLRTLALQKATTLFCWGQKTSLFYVKNAGNWIKCTKCKFFEGEGICPICTHRAPPYRCDSHRGWRSESHRGGRSESHRFTAFERWLFCAIYLFLLPIKGEDEGRRSGGTKTCDEEKRTRMEQIKRMKAADCGLRQKKKAWTNFVYASF